MSAWRMNFRQAGHNVEQVKRNYTQKAQSMAKAHDHPIHRIGALSCATVLGFGLLVETRASPISESWESAGINRLGVANGTSRC